MRAGRSALGFVFISAVIYSMAFFRAPSVLPMLSSPFDVADTSGIVGRPLRSHELKLLAPEGPRARQRVALQPLGAADAVHRTRDGLQSAGRDRLPAGVAESVRSLPHFLLGAREGLETRHEDFATGEIFVLRHVVLERLQAVGPGRVVAVMGSVAKRILSFHHSQSLAGAARVDFDGVGGCGGRAGNPCLVSHGHRPFLRLPNKKPLARTAQEVSIAVEVPPAGRTAGPGDRADGLTVFPIYSPLLGRILDVGVLRVNK